MMNILFFVLCLVTCSASHRVDGTQNTPKEDLELESQLQIINKPPVKSIHTKFGDIVDCIDINKQPAFDHPLLKNHKLQRKSSFQKSIGKTSLKKSSARPMLGLEKDQCPTGTVPIRRTTKDNLIQAKSLLNSHMKIEDNPGVHLAEVTLVSNFAPYYGVKGNTSVYNPKAEKDQMSAGHLWVEKGPVDTNNKIFAGWHVAPQVYGGDTATYIYSAWTSDNFKKTGCFNLQCPGFVQTNKQYYLGVRVANPSKDTVIVELAISIKQDPKTGNWWLNLENKDIGYFPATLFSNLTSADQAGWGGRTATTDGTPSPPMGSGILPDDNFSHVAYFRQVSYQNASRQDYGPYEYDVQTFTDRSDCYGVEYYGDQGRQAGYSLQFGGPGGNCGD